MEGQERLAAQERPPQRSRVQPDLPLASSSNQPAHQQSLQARVRTPGSPPIPPPPLPRLPLPVRHASVGEPPLLRRRGGLSPLYSHSQRHRALWRHFAMADEEEEEEEEEDRNGEDELSEQLVALARRLGLHHDHHAQDDDDDSSSGGDAAGRVLISALAPNSDDENEEGEEGEGGVGFLRGYAHQRTQLPTLEELVQHFGDAVVEARYRRARNEGDDEEEEEEEEEQGRLGVAVEEDGQDEDELDELDEGMGLLYANSDEDEEDGEGIEEEEEGEEEEEEDDEEEGWRVLARSSRGLPFRYATRVRAMPDPSPDPSPPLNRFSDLVLRKLKREFVSKHGAHTASLHHSHTPQVFMIGLTSVFWTHVRQHDPNSLALVRDLVACLPSVQEIQRQLQTQCYLADQITIKLTLCMHELYHELHTSPPHTELRRLILPTLIRFYAMHACHVSAVNNQLLQGLDLPLPSLPDASSFAAHYRTKLRDLNNRVGGCAPSDFFA